MFIGVPRLNWHESIRAFVPAFLLLNFCGKVRITWLLLSIEKAGRNCYGVKTNRLKRQ